MATEILRPNAAGDETNFTALNGAATHWEAVDEASPDNGTTYTGLLNDAAGEVFDSYNLGATALTTEVIDQINVKAVIWGAAGSNSTYRLGVRLSSTNEMQGSATVHNADSWSAFEFLNVPRPGGGSWAVSDLNSLQVRVGANTGGTTGELLYTQVYVEVVNHAAGTAALTGTAITGGVLESEIVAGGQTIIATLTGDTYVPATTVSTITFVANALGGTTTTTSFNITLPATAAGDIIILEFTHRGTGDGTIGGTYTGGAFALKHSQLYASSAFSGKTYWSRATGNHTGETVTGSGLTNSCAAIITIYRGCVATGDPLAGATIVGEENASGDESNGEITTGEDGCMVVLVVVNSPDLAVATQAATSPATLIERAERLSTGGTDTSIAHASELKASAGATGALTWTQTNAASGSWAYAIKPAVSTPFADARQAFINGFDSAQSEATGWDAEVKAKEVVSAIVRTSDTVVTWTLTAQAAYAITANETITGTIPGSILTGASPIVATPTFDITDEAGAILQTLTGSLTPTGGLSKQASKALSGSVTGAGALIRLASKALAGSVTAAGVLVKQARKVLSGSVTMAGALLRMPVKVLGGSATMTGALTRSAARVLSGSLTAAGALAKATSKPLGGAITATGSLSMFKVIEQLLTGSLTMAGNLTRDVVKPLAGSVTATGALAKAASKAFTGSITPTGDLSMLKVIAQLLEGSLTMTGALTRSVSKSLAGAVAGAGSLVKDTSKSLAGSITATGSLTATLLFTLLLTGTLTMTGALTKASSKVLSGVLTPVGSLGKQAAKLLGGVITLVGDLIAALVLPAEPPVVTEFPGLDDTPLRFGLEQTVAYAVGLDDVPVRVGVEQVTTYLDGLDEAERRLRGHT